MKSSLFCSFSKFPFISIYFEKLLKKITDYSFLLLNCDLFVKAPLLTRRKMERTAEQPHERKRNEKILRKLTETLRFRRVCKGAFTEFGSFLLNRYFFVTGSIFFSTKVSTRACPDREFTTLAYLYRLIPTRVHMYKEIASRAQFIKEILGY